MYLDNQEFIAILFGDSSRSGTSIGSAVVKIGLKMRDRQTNLRKRPGTAAMISWTRALLEVFPRAEVIASLGGFVAALARGDASEALPWRDLPGLGCLVKVAEDLDRLGAHEPARGAER
jgi:hypothetical protein